MQTRVDAFHDRFPALPALEAGVTELVVEEDARGAVQALALDRAMTASGPVYWIDADGVARTTRLAELAPEPRVLDRIRLARGFTAHQHAALLERTPRSLPAEAALLVVPAADAVYRACDLVTHRARTLFRHGMRRLARLARDRDLAVLLTRQERDEFSTVGDVVDTRVRCEATTFGPRFVGDGFETFVYPPEDGSRQTTFAYWREILKVRRRGILGPRADPDRTAPAAGAGSGGGR